MRSLHYDALGIGAVEGVLKVMGFKARFTGSPAAANYQLQKTVLVLDSISTAIQNYTSSTSEPIPIGFVWAILNKESWTDVLNFASAFAFKTTELLNDQDNIERILKISRQVESKETSMGDGLGNPFILLATYLKDHLLGVQVSLILQAVYLVSLVINNEGTLIWNRLAVEMDHMEFKRTSATWSNGFFHTNFNSLSKLRVSAFLKYRRPPARLLNSYDVSVESESLSKGEVEFTRTRDVAVASRWLDVSIREIRLDILSKLLRQNQKDLEEYVKIEGVSLADLVQLGMQTAISSPYSLVLMFGNRVYQWPSLKELQRPGHLFLVDWGLTRKCMSKFSVRRQYHYLRGYYDYSIHDWSYTVNNETFLARPSLGRKMMGVLSFTWFGLKSGLLLGPASKIAAVNRNDAKERISGNQPFVESAEETSMKPSVDDLMRHALSDRIEVTSNSSHEKSWAKCFGDVKSSGGCVQDDELVIVLSYRHESENVRMSIENWKYCHDDILQLAVIHGKSAARVWTDKLSKLSRGNAGWIQSGVEPYRNAVVLAYNGKGDSIFVDRFWLTLERNTGVRSWGYWYRDDLGDLVRLGTKPYPARVSDSNFLAQIFFTPGRADNNLWEKDRMEVLKEARDQLGIVDANSFWDTIADEPFERYYLSFNVAIQPRQAGNRYAQGWEPLADSMLDRDLLEKSLGFEIRDRLERKIRKWKMDKTTRAVAAKSLVSDNWFFCKVEVEKAENGMKVVDVFERVLASPSEMEEFLSGGFQECDEEVWI